MSSPRVTCKPASWVQKTRRCLDCCAVQSMNLSEECVTPNAVVEGLALNDLNSPQRATELTHNSSSSTHYSDESTEDEVMKRVLRRMPRGNPLKGMQLRDLHGNFISSPDQPSTLSTSSYSSSDESIGDEYTDLGYTICADSSSEQTLSSVTVIQRDADEPPMMSDVLCSTLSYPLSSTIMMSSVVEEQADLSLMIDEEKILMKENRKPWDEKRTLRRQSGSVRLPGLK